MMSYKDDKYAPQPNEDIHKVHARQLSLIRHQQDENRKVREKKTPKVSEPADQPEALATQPGATFAPQNPDAPQNNP